MEIKMSWRNRLANITLIIQHYYLLEHNSLGISL